MIVTGQELRPHLRCLVAGTAVRDYADLYELHIDGRFAGITDEYGTCHYATVGFTTAQIEDTVEVIE